MRLTLRTMLCYLDDVLEPQDAKELGAKIEESEYASNVVHRIRTSMRRLRLGAPAPVGKNMGLDPNTVADYLDNTLPPERVSDFERVCLDMESEKYLAEVAACHQILTLVLGEPAEVSTALRDRVYAIGRGETQKPTTESSAVAAPPAGEAPAAASASHVADGASVQHRVDAPQPAHSQRQKPVVPEYLKIGSQRSWWPVALTVALLLLFAGGALWSTGALDFLLRPNQVADAGDGKDKANQLFNIPGDESGDENADTEGSSSNPKGTVQNGTAESEGQANNGNGKGDASDSNNTATDKTPPKTGDGSSSDAPKTSTDLVLDPGSKEPAAGGGGASTTDAESGGASIEGAVPAGSGTEPTLPPVDKAIGHYVSAGQVMAFFDAETSTWLRLPQRAAIKPGMQLLALPTYRPQLVLENKIQITFAGEADVAIANPVKDAPAIVLHSGRAMIATMGETGNQLALDADGRNILLTMGNIEAEIAVEVHRFHLPGTDPRAERPHVQVIATVARGQVQWHPQGAEPVTLDAGQAISFVDDAAATVSNGVEPPKWIKSNDISDIDRLASATLEPLLDDEQSLQVILEEQALQAGQSRVEVRSLAARCLASIGHFDRIIDSFNDESLKSYWLDHLNHLRQRLAHSPQMAEAAATAAVRRKGDQAPRVYRLFWGFSPPQLSDGADKMLVEYLQDDALDVRVLAIQNLQRITGRTYGYHPHYPEARRRTAQREWDQQAAVAGKIIYSELPPELPPRKE